MKGKLIILISLATLVGMLLITRAVRQAQSDQLQNPYSGIVTVSTVKAKSESFGRIISESGILTGNRESMIAAETGGKVTALFVEPGSRVVAGDPILKIDDELYGLEAERAKISFDKAKLDLERIERLHRQNGASDSDLENARLMAKGAEVAYKMADKTYRDATICAPFAGIIAEKFTEIGQMVAPGTHVVQLIDQSSLKLTIQIPEESIRYIDNGTPASVTIDALGRTMEGRVTSIGSKAASGSRTFPVEVRIRGDETIRSGMFARADIEAGSFEAVVLPRIAVLPEAGRSIIYIVRDNLAEKAIVTLLGQQGDKVALEGVAEGDLVVTAGNQSIAPGTSLNIAGEGASAQ